jgi:hypothetical protein
MTSKWPKFEFWESTPNGYKYGIHPSKIKQSELRFSSDYTSSFLRAIPSKGPVAEVGAVSAGNDRLGRCTAKIFRFALRRFSPQNLFDPHCRLPLAWTPDPLLRPFLRHLCQIRSAAIFSVNFPIRSAAQRSCASSPSLPPYRAFPPDSQIKKSKLDSHVQAYLPF